MNEKRYCPKGHDTTIMGRTKSHCNICLKAYRKEYSKAYYRRPGAENHYREKGWKSYGILNESAQPFLKIDYDRLYQIQKGCCKICQTHQSDLTITLAVDHNHENGIVRGLLCIPCNNGLGTYEKMKSQFEKYLGDSNAL
jgi:hypothetical protein